MDLNRFDTKTKANAGIEFALNDLRTGKPTDAKFRIVGSDSEHFQRLKAERSRKVAKRLQETGAEALTPEEMDEMACEMLAACTLGWSGLNHDGKPVPFSTEKAKEVYSQYPAIRDQINLAIADRANFLLA